MTQGFRTGRFRIGVDIGGTFTDIVLTTPDETIMTRKVSSTPDDYSRGILDGVAAMLEEAGGRPGQVDELVHATTVATNTVLEGKGARTALITTRGFRDVLEIGRLRMPELYNLDYTKPQPLVPRRRRYEVSERMGPDGGIETALQEEDVVEAARAIRAAGAEAVAVSLLHAYANGTHEERIRLLLAEHLPPEVFVTCSHEVLPEIREYERTSTTVVNAYVGPVVTGYLRSLREKLRARGMNGPLQIMQSNGGVMTAESAMEKPACIIESGPAAGVIAAAQLAKVIGLADLITIDMGGTTAKAAIIEQGEPARTTEYEVGAGINLSSKLIKGGGHAVKLPYIDVSEIGAGGGSIVRVDSGGVIRVGPDSAGSIPGPVCYDTGGALATLTDALVTIGYVNPESIAGGAVRLNAGKARAAIAEQVARPTGLSPLDAALGIYSIAASTMTRAVKAVSTFRGRDPRDFTLFAFGGNGPVIAVEIARLLSMRRVIVPPNPGVFSALGLLYARTEHELIHTVYRDFAALDAAELDARFAAVEAKARAGLLRDGYHEADILLDRLVDLRYAGQAYELSIRVVRDEAELPDLAKLAAAFHAEHDRTYGHHSTTDPVELVNVRVVGRSRVQDARSYDPRAARQRRRAAAPRTPTRQAYFGPERGSVATPVLGREDLAGGPVAGPAIIEEYDATCVVPPGWRAVLDGFGNIDLTQGDE
jgi:N-methylhydantoinase A